MAAFHKRGEEHTSGSGKKRPQPAQYACRRVRKSMRHSFMASFMKWTAKDLTGLRWNGRRRRGNGVRFETDWCGRRMRKEAEEVMEVKEVEERIGSAIECAGELNWGRL